jgi:glycosyltransferase involved in cell wall biosynthesis
MAAEPRTILHVIERLTLGGASRALIAAAAHSTRTTGTCHRLISLRPAHPVPAQRARDAGLESADPDRIADEIELADVVHVHFWNTPELYEALRGPLPPARIALTSHVGGATSPHILTDELVALADLILVTSPHSLQDANAALREKAVVAPSVADFDRLKQVTPVPHPGFTVGYVGTVDFAKMEPRFVAMHAALDLPDLKVIVCGDGGARRTLEQQAESPGASGRFEFLGHVEDIASVLGALDVFGYPLCEGNYATAELVLHEAMYAGLPCVVFDRGGPAHVVRDGETGFVVANETDYADRIAFLHDHPEERRRMSEAAAAYARAHFGADNLAPLIDAAYDQLMATKKRERGAGPAVGAEALIRSLGEAAAPFEASLAGGPPAGAADESIAGASPALASADAGGVLHYRRFYPDDPALRFWAGLILLAQARPALAAAEFRAAQKLGFDADRCVHSLSRAVEAATAGVYQ